MQKQFWLMGLDLSPVYLEDVWMADGSYVAEVLLAEEAGEVLNDLTFPPEIQYLQVPTHPQ